MKPTVGITLGDPAGIGPEVIAKSLARPSIRRLGNFRIINETAGYQNKLKPGCPNQHSARAALASLQKSAELLKKKEITALVTAPVCKKSISALGKPFHGHTEFLAQAFDVKNFEMMFVSRLLKVVILTRHIPLSKISQAITPNKVYNSIRLTARSLRHFFQVKSPRIAVCGLNPHAGEGGEMGREEISKIIPAIRKARKNRIDVLGPFAADTLFSPEKLKNFDAVIAMYHDQGLIPAKTLAFSNVVNLTIGLPFIRTSPSHGTAFDIAGKNKADPSSMSEAIKLAVMLCHSQAKNI